MSGCSCNSSINNTGVVSKQFLMEDARRLILVPTFNAQGVKNGIDLSDVPTALADVQALLNATSSLARYFPLPKMENAAWVRPNSEFESAQSGNRYKIRNGISTFTAEIFNQGHNLYRKMEGFKCEKMAYYIVDRCGNLFGDASVSGYLYPIAIQDTTFDPILMKATGNSVSKIQINFDLVDSFKDEHIGGIEASEFEYSWLELNGLIDVYATAATSISTTGFTMVFSTDYGSVTVNKPITGLVAADLSLFNVTDASAITPFTLAESTTTPGTYTLTYTAQTSADVIRVTPGTGFASASIPTVTTP